MDNINLKLALTSTLKSLGYSDSLTNKALTDLEQVIAIRYYNRIVSLLPKTSTTDLVEGDHQKVIELAKGAIDQATLQDQLLAITKEVVSEYLEEMATEQKN